MGETSRERMGGEERGGGGGGVGYGIEAVLELGYDKAWINLPAKCIWD